MRTGLLPLPQFRHASIRHDFNRIDDYVSWVRPLLGKADFDCLRDQQPYRSSHRSLMLGGLNIASSEYSAGVRVGAVVKDQVLFTFNAIGSVQFKVENQSVAPSPSAGVLVVTPSEGSYMRARGGGLMVTTRPQILLDTALAMHGPLAAQRLRQRLQQPLQFFGYGAGDSISLPRSLLQSLELVDSLLSPKGTVPAALSLDDLVTRQLVFLLCPELMHEPEESSTAHSVLSFDQLLEWITSRLDQPLSLTQLEQQSGYSRRALQRAFQGRFGCGPMQWLRRQRLEQALAQLTRASQRDTVSAIARRCGYLSLSSFSRDFTGAYGRKPSEVLLANRPSG